jgi:antitoxin MazE
MKAELIRIGNSQGIRIPKPIIDQCGFHGSVEITVEGNALIIKPVREVRQGWEERFKAMAASGDDRLLDEDSPATEWHAAEWQW